MTSCFKNIIKNNFFIFLFFITYFCIGASIFTDYGVSWDEPQQRFHNGEYNYRYIFQNSNELIDGTEKYHGPVFELLLIVLEKVFQLDDTRHIYFMRHFVTWFLFYLSVIFFFLLCKEQFQSWQFALLGSLFLILSPRIFAHSFYNSKDIPFLSVFIICNYTLIKFLDKQTLLRTFLHAFASAILIDIRILGILIPFLTFIFIIFDFLVNIKEQINISKKIIFNCFSYFIFTFLFTIFFWPILWEGPLYHFIMAFKEMSRFKWERPNLYLGNDVVSTQLPWHYVPVWLIVTTPLLYTLSFFIGLSHLAFSLCKNLNISSLNQKRNYLIFLLWLFIPLVSVIVFKSVLYDGWRHMFFIYPAFLLISLHGLKVAFDYLKSNIENWFYKIVYIVIGFIIVISIVNISRFMIACHPYQNVYFNRIAGKDMKAAKNNFEMDYWGLSYKEALEYIIKNDPDEKIDIYVEYDIGPICANILPEKDKRRLIFVPAQSIEKAKYYLSTYRNHKDGHSYKNEFYSAKVGNAKIMVIYQLKKRGDHAVYISALETMPIYTESFQNGLFIKSWLVLGKIPATEKNHFGRNLLDEHGGELRILPNENMTHHFAGNTSLKWFKHTFHQDFLDFNELFGQSQYTSAYAFTTFKSTKSQNAIFAIGSDDQISIWLNGEPIHYIPYGRPAIKDQDQIPVMLREGMNSILIKLNQEAGEWGFYFRVLVP